MVTHNAELAARFPIRLDGIWRVPLLIIGATPNRAYLEIEHNILNCRYGWWHDRIDIADVVDVDELKTHERREGMFGSIFWWVVKLGMAAALAGGGFLLNATGFDVALQGAQTERAIFLMRLCDAVIPMVTSAIAIWAVARFPITEETAREVRLELERRRGRPGEIEPATA